MTGRHSFDIMIPVYVCDDDAIVVVEVYVCILSVGILSASVNRTRIVHFL